jgi:hypothetical protein
MVGYKDHVIMVSFRCIRNSYVSCLGLVVMTRSFSAEPLSPNKLKLAEQSIGLFILVIDFATGISPCWRRSSIFYYFIAHVKLVSVAVCS